MNDKSSATSHKEALRIAAEMAEDWTLPTVRQNQALELFEYLKRLVPSAATALTDEELRIAQIYESAGTAYPGDQEAAGILARAALRLARSSTTESFGDKCRRLGYAERPLLPSEKVDQEALRLAREFIDPASEGARECAIRAIGQEVGPKTEAMVREAIVVARELVRIASATTRVPNAY